MLKNYLILNIKESLPWLIMGLCVAAFFLAITWGLIWHFNADFSFFLRDSNAIAKQPFYYGFLEMISGSALLMSSAILFFTTISEKLPPHQTRFLLLLGLLTFSLGLDDLCMLHESVNLIYWRLNELYAYGFYAALLAVIGILNFELLLKTPVTIFGISLVLLGLAEIQDQTGKPFFNLPMEEDLFEFFAFILWASYSVRIAYMLKHSLIPVESRGTMLDMYKFAITKMGH